jgi:carboxypeptidase PM20D1
MKKALLGVALTVLILVGVILIRTARLTSTSPLALHPKEIKLETHAIADRLAQAIRYKTISRKDSVSSNEEFLRFHHFLQTAFPLVHVNLVREVVGGHSLLFTWAGRNPLLRPILLMGHIDVVPIDPGTERRWTYPPFAGRIAHGYIWGRGALDDKASVLGMLEAVEHLLTEAFQPERTVYLAFGHDEELGGNMGAAAIAELLQSRRLQLDYVLDEGGYLTEGIIPDVDRQVAMVGIAEKGYVSVELVVEAAGGHSSMPPNHTAIGVLSKAIHKLENSPFPSRIVMPTQRFLERLGAGTNLGRAIMTANLWLFDPLIRREMDKSPWSRAMIRTTQAPTVFEAGVSDNVLPGKARAIINFRVLTGDTIGDVLAHVKKTIDDPTIKITPLSPQIEPSAISDISSDSFKPIERAIGATFPGTIIAPSLLIAATDSRHYTELTNNTYRFMPIAVRADDTERFHGIDERVSIKDYENAVRFFVELIRTSN